MSATELHPEIDPAHFRRVMGCFATGVTVILAEARGERRGMTANAFFSGSLNPPLCVVSVAKRAHMHAHLAAAERFSVNVLAAGQENLAMHFAGRHILDEPELGRRDGAPILPDAVAVIVADRVASHDCGDHTLYVGHIRLMDANDRPPLLYYRSQFAALLAISGEPTPGLPEFW